MILTARKSSMNLGIVFMAAACGIVCQPAAAQSVATDKNPGYLLYATEGKFGYVDRQGKVAIKPQFELAGPFSDNGLAPFSRNGKFGFIDRQGNVAIEPKFDLVTVFDGNGIAQIKSNDKLGLIDSSGRVILEPQYQMIGAFAANGLARVMSRSGTGKPATPADGKTTYRARHILLDREEEARALIARLKSGARFEDLAGQSKDTGSGARGGDLGWSRAEALPPALAAVLPGMQTGQVYDAPLKSQFGYHVLKLEEVRSEGSKQSSAAPLYGYVNMRGNVVIEPQFEDAGDFAANGLARVATGPAKYGYVDARGKLIIQPQFQSAQDFAANGLARIKQNNRFGFVNARGDIVVQPQYQWAYDFAANGTARVLRDGQWSVIDTSGAPVSQNAVETAAGDFSPIINSSKYFVLRDRGSARIPLLQESAYTPPVRDQGAFGICYAASSAAIVDAATCQATGLTGQDCRNLPDNKKVSMLTMSRLTSLVGAISADYNEVLAADNDWAKRRNLSHPGNFQRLNNGGRGERALDIAAHLSLPDGSGAFDMSQLATEACAPSAPVIRQINGLGGYEGLYQRWKQYQAAGGYGNEAERQAMLKLLRSAAPGISEAQILDGLKISMVREDMFQQFLGKAFYPIPCLSVPDARAQHHELAGQFIRFDRKINQLPSYSGALFKEGLLFNIRQAVKADAPPILVEGVCGEFDSSGKCLGGHSLIVIGAGFVCAKDARQGPEQCKPALRVQNSWGEKWQKERTLQYGSYDGNGNPQLSQERSDGWVLEEDFAKTIQPPQTYASSYASPVVTMNRTGAFR